MGTFYAHAVPGVAFIIWGLWLLINNCYSYAISKRLKIPYKSKLYFGLSNLFRSLIKGDNNECLFIDLSEACVILWACSYGVISEIITGYNVNLTEEPRYVIISENAQHSCMYAMFALSPLMHLLSVIGKPLMDLPNNIGNVMFTLACFSETLLFYHHLHGRDEFDIHLHNLVIILTAGCTILSAIELFVDSYGISLMRSVFLVAQGTWFFHVGFALYNPFSSVKYDENYWPSVKYQHRQLMLTTSAFIIHLIAILLRTFTS